MVDDIFLSRPGAINGAVASEAAASATFLKLFSGEVLDAFDEYNVMYDLVEKRQLPRGSKSAQFLVTGRAKAAGLLPDGSGNVSTLFNNSTFMNRIQSNEKEVFADGPIIAATSLFEFDEMRAQYDVRAGHARELGRGVAEEFDTRALLMLVNGARAASLITASAVDNDRRGERRLDADFNTNGASAVATLFSLKRLLDSKFVPQLDRHVIITPEAYSNLAQQTDLLNRDWVSGSNGDFADGTVLKVAGFQLHISARLRSSDLAAGLGDFSGSAANRAGCLNLYQGNTIAAPANGGTSAQAAGDNSKVVALAFHKSAIGAVDAMGMTMESDYIIEMQSTLLVAKKICGLSWLRPECIVEISDA